MIKSSKAYEQAVTADARRVYAKAVVDIIDPDMVRGTITSSGQDADVSRLPQIWNHEFSHTANYAALEPNRWILDGYTQLLPDEQPEWEAGLVGAPLSGIDGKFPAPQFAQITFSNTHILQACSIAFSDDPEDGVGEEFTVEISSQGVTYFTREVKGNTQALVNLMGFRVYYPDTLRVTVTKWSLPGRRMRILELVPGIYETWMGDEMEQFQVKMQGDVSCLTLPYGTASIRMDNQDRRFEPRNKDGVFLMIEERQGIELYMGVGLPSGKIEWKMLGVFYQHGDGWKTGDNDVTMKWDLVDIVGLLARRRYIPKGSTPKTLGGWIAALVGQLGRNFAKRYKVDPDYADKPVTPPGSVSGLNCGDILRYVCMATQTWPRADASTGYLTAEPLWNQGNKITLDNMEVYPVMTANPGVSSVTINDYTALVTDSTSSDTVSVTNPFISTMDQRTAAARAILSTKGGDRFELTGRGDPSSEIGDVDTIWLDNGNAATARRIMQELSFSGGVLKSCKSVLIRGDGIFQYAKRVQFLYNGTFTVPEGVWRLRLILVGAGADGNKGDDGIYFCTTSWMGQLVFPPPAGAEDLGPGNNGGGGKIFETIIDVNPGQVFDVTVGVPRSMHLHSTFGPFSSANGKNYPNGFTDVANGESFGRAGVGGAKPGSGDGGIGGEQGEWGRTYATRDFIEDPPGSGRGYWSNRYIKVETHPTKGKEGTPGASGSVIIYYEEPPEEVEE